MPKVATAHFFTSKIDTSLFLQKAFDVLRKQLLQLEKVLDPSAYLLKLANTTLLSLVIKNKTIKKLNIHFRDYVELACKCTYTHLCMYRRRHRNSTATVTFAIISSV